LTLSGAVLKAGTLTLEATRDRTLDAEAQGVTAGGVVVGVAQARADTGGSNRITVTGLVGQAPGSVVNDLVINAHSLTIATAQAKAVAGGVLAGNGADAQAIQTSTTPDGVFLIDSRIAVANDASVNATSWEQSEVNAYGLNVGGATVGVSHAEASTAPDARVEFTGVTLTAGRDVKIGSSAQGASIADATASGGGVLVGSGATVKPTSKPNATVTFTAAGFGEQNRVTAGGALAITAEDGMNASGTADSPSYGAFSVGAAEANGVENGSAGINIGQRTHLVAGSDLTVNASEVPTVTIGPVYIRGVFATGTASSASSKLVRTSHATVTVGDEVNLKAGGRLAVHATTDGTTHVSSAAPFSLSGPSKSSRADSETTSVSSIDLGNSSVSAQVVDLSAKTNVLVENELKGFSPVLPGGTSLNQNDKVSVTATIKSGSKFYLKAVEWNPLPVAVANAIADGLTNNDPRHVIDGGNKPVRKIDLLGDIRLERLPPHP
jgi:hypothetical protein